MNIFSILNHKPLNRTLKMMAKCIQLCRDCAVLQERVDERHCSRDDGQAGIYRCLEPEGRYALVGAEGLHPAEQALNAVFNPLE